MLKKSKVVALLVVCVMMFTAVEPAFAWWGEDTAYGTAVGGATGGFWGAVIGATIVGVTTIATGGFGAITLVAIGSAALTGATYGAAGGAATGAVVGAITDKRTVDDCAVIASVVSAVATPIVGVVTVAGKGAVIVGTLGTLGYIGDKVFDKVIDKVID